MSETDLLDPLPDALRVSNELGWVYTSSSRIAKVFALPHEEVVSCITTMTEQLEALGEEAEMALFRYGFLTYQGPKPESFEILLSHGLFWLLTIRLDGKGVQQWRRIMVDRMDQMGHAIQRMYPEKWAAQA